MPDGLTYRVHKEVVKLGNDAENIVTTYRFSDGTVWTTVSEWAKNRSGQWRSGRLAVWKGPKADKKSTYPALQRALGGAAEVRS